MDDPFFAAVGSTVEPVRATRQLEPEVDSWRAPERPVRRAAEKSREQYRPARVVEPTHVVEEHEHTVEPVRPAPKKKRYCENNRMPSMLNNIAEPKPLRIFPNKPPNSKKLFDVVIPDQWTYAEPYSDD